MRDYELTVLFHPDLEMNLEPALDKVKKIVEDNGGKINKVTEDGKKRLAYRIAKQDFAIYYIYEVSLPANAPSKISSTLNITDEVIRYLLVSVSERKVKATAKDEAKKAETEEEKEEK